MLTVPADLNHLPGGRGKSGAQAAAESISDVAVDDGSTDATHEEKREAKRRSSAGHVGRHSAAAVTAEHGLTACSCTSVFT